jgi:hypothetical protein
MTNYRLLANVRQRGALGVFQPRWFNVRSADELSARLDWFPLYSERWELHNIITVSTGVTGDHFPTAPEPLITSTQE